MFNCPDNYEEALKYEQEWIQQIEMEYRKKVVKTFPIMCKFFNLSSDFTEEELEKAYKQARHKYHPDKPDGDKEKFMQASEFYSELKSIRKYYPELTYNPLLTRMSNLLLPS